MSENDVQLGSIEAAYRGSYRQFLHVATAITGSRELAADAVQEAFVRAIARRQTFRRGGPIEAWIWRIVVNTARDTAARRRDLPAPEPSPDAIPSGSAGHEVEIRAAVSALPERQRLVLFLRYFADLDYQAIGEVLAISSGTVGATLHNAHNALRKQFEEVQSG